MNGQNLQNIKPLSTKKDLQNKVSEFLPRCIECQKCIDACPVTKEEFSIKELNGASQEGSSVSLMIMEFAFHCTQCGRCVPVCPKDLRRDLMMLLIKHKLRNKKPWGYIRYLLIKGPKTKLKRIIQRLFVLGKKLTNRNLACFMETIPNRKPEVLFYPGCYIYSTKTIRQTRRLLDHVGCSYGILGGVTACCGAPHLLQGEFDQADECRHLLSQKIKAYDPKIILTACAECFEAVSQIKKTYQMDVEILSVVQYLMHHQVKFPKEKIRGKVAIHESCRFQDDSPQGRAVHDAVHRFAEPVDSPNHPPSCCYQWNHDSDPNNAIRRRTYLTSVKTHAQTLVCNCLTCYEELNKAYTDVEIIDVLQLFEESLDAVENTEDIP